MNRKQRARIYAMYSLLDDLNLKFVTNTLTVSEETIEFAKESFDENEKLSRS